MSHMTPKKPCTECRNCRNPPLVRKNHIRTARPLVLDSLISTRRIAPMLRTRLTPPLRFAVGAALAVSLGLAGSSFAAAFSTATVTKVENKVLIGERKAERSITRPAAANDVMQANNFLRSDTDSRAELQYPDGTVVRVGQNTVFTFDSTSRTLALDRGSLLFHIPKGS